MDSRLIRARPALPKPLLLKDYLLDDMSSCSSNSFKSFPRRQCCTTVPFLQDFDLKNKQQRQQKKHLNFNKTPPKSAISAFQSVITAAKRLPFPAAKSPEKQKLKNSFLPRSFSKKIFKKNTFWKRKPVQKEIARLKSFDQLLKEDSEPSLRSYGSITTSESKNNSWFGSDFTVLEERSSGNSSSEVNLNLPVARDDVVEEPKKVVCGKRVDVTNGDVSTESTTICDTDGSATTKSPTEAKEKQWSNGDHKEQLSPVSVLDCPFDDEDDEVSSPFQHRLSRVEGTKKKLIKKIQRFECLAKLEPVNLANRFALQPNSDNESSTGIPRPHSFALTDHEKFVEEEEWEKEAEERALELLHQMKAILPSYGLKLKADKLLLDFFREKITDEYANAGKQYYREGSSFDEGLIEEAEDWIKGQKASGQVLMEWEVQKNRQAYVKELERGGEWKTLDQENQKIASELVTEVFAALVNELVLDISI